MPRESGASSCFGDDWIARSSRAMTAGQTLGLILAGGLARRMGGGDKPLKSIGGVSILDRVIARTKPQCGALILNANGDPQRFAATGLPVIADEQVRLHRAGRNIIPIGERRPQRADDEDHQQENADLVENLFLVDRHDVPSLRSEAVNVSER